MNLLPCQSYKCISYFSECKDEIQCQLSSCHQDCEWSDWSEWNDCDKICGVGSMYRNRTVKVPASNGGKKCDASLDSEMQDCNIDSCSMWTFQLL